MRALVLISYVLTETPSVPWSRLPGDASGAGSSAFGLRSSFSRLAQPGYARTRHSGINCDVGTTQSCYHHSLWPGFKAQKSGHILACAASVWRQACYITALAPATVIWIVQPTLGVLRPVNRYDYIRASLHYIHYTHPVPNKPTVSVDVKQHSTNYIHVHSSGAVLESRWPYGFRGRKELLNRASALVTTSVSLICQLTSEDTKHQLIIYIHVHSSGAVWDWSRWPSWAVRPNEPYGFRGRKELLNHASALVSACP